MKTIKKQLITILVLLQGVGAFSQAVIPVLPLGAVFAIVNTDLKSTLILKTIAAASSARAGVVGTTLGLVDQSKRRIDEFTKKKYDKTKYDSKSGFLSAIKTGAMTLGTKILQTKFSKGYYMTKNKQDFMNTIGLEKASLMTMQLLDYNSLTAGDRQEIYRLRNEITKEYSVNDREVIKLLLLPAIKYSVEVAPELAQLVKAMELIE